MPRVLFVDDEQPVLDGFRRLLHDAAPDLQLGFATSVDDALVLLRESGAEVVVADVMMPGRDGFQLLTTMLNDERLMHIPVVMVTGHADEDLKRRALDLGAADLMTKPVQRADLMARVRSALRLRANIENIRAQADTLRKTATELAASRRDLIWCLARAAEQRDSVTGRHVLRVAAYCGLIGSQLGVDPAFVEMLTLASPLHDVGKIGTPDAVLGKTARLTEAEWAIMQRHCEIGAEILNPNRGPTRLSEMLERATGGVPTIVQVADNEVLRMAASIALTHHERWDGAGYPHGLVGPAIPLESRIVAVADVYDALRTVRPYKPAYSDAVAVEMMKAEVGRHFDPRIFAAFEVVLPRIREILTEVADPEDLDARQVA